MPQRCYLFRKFVLAVTTGGWDMGRGWSWRWQSVGWSSGNGAAGVGGKTVWRETTGWVTDWREVGPSKGLSPGDGESAEPLVRKGSYPRGDGKYDSWLWGRRSWLIEFQVLEPFLWPAVGVLCPGGYLEPSLWSCLRVLFPGWGVVKRLLHHGVRPGGRQSWHVTRRHALRWHSSSQWRIDSLWRERSSPWFELDMGRVALAFHLPSGRCREVEL